MAVQTSAIDSSSIHGELTYDDISLETDLQPWSDSLRKYFTPKQVDMLNRAVAEFKTIQTAKDLANFYQVTLRDSVQPMVEHQFQMGCKHADYGSFADDDWDWIGEFFPTLGTRAACKELENGMECVHHAPLSMIPLRELASKTPEKTDDVFFDAVIAVYTGSQPGADLELMEIFDETEDYEPTQTVGCETCVVSMLGDGHRSEIVTKLATAASARKMFSVAVTEDIHYLFQDLKEDHYYSDKQAVLKELDDIIATGKESKLLTARELTSLEETRSWIDQKEGGFDCGRGNCNF